MNTTELRKASQAIFIAAEQIIAQDIATKLTWAANEIDRLNKEPRLGCATTGELIDELRARCEVNGTINYLTVGDD